MPENKPNPGLWTARQNLATVVVLLAIISGLAAVLMPNFFIARPQGRLTSCKSNCKNVGTALEMYATDNGRRYPQGFQQLTAGNYLKLVPTCPASGRAYDLQSTESECTVTCAGRNHKEHPENFPKYSGRQGLLLH